MAKKRLAQETTKSIWALVFLGAAILFSLAGLSQAGRAGNAIYSGLSAMFGWGYLLLPLTLFGISLNLFLNKRETKLHGSTLWGAVLFLLSTLGVIDVFFDNDGGYIGRTVGYLKNWLGTTAWGITLGIAAIIGIIVVFDRPLLWKTKKDTDENREEEELEIHVKTQEQTFAEKPEKDKDETGEDKDEKEEREIGASFAAPKMKKGAVLKNSFADYKTPPLDILKTAVEKPAAGDLRANANIIKRTLESFGIPVEMGEINIGPKVTRYTLRPAEGIKLSRITALNQDLSLALSAHPIRIEAPIPGRPYIGIEIPNKSAAVVRLGNLMAYPEFVSSGMLGFCLGRDVTGEPVFGNIEKMPHLLIAGATGSGKSIALHSILISLLFKNSPRTLKLILIDPKRVELSIYRGLPHLVSPIITQGKKALGVFRWAVSEMENRYEILLKAGARDIQSYNKKNPEEPLSFLLIVVDEVADLMAVYGRDIENTIVRLAQMARATGIHLILSTQRPSVEVVTGLIKANITSRIALQVASQIDSRTILDTAGAEKLLGGGDLLFVSAELSKPRRVQGSYISEDEIKTVTDFIRKHNEESAEELSFNGSGETQNGVSDETYEKKPGSDPFEEFEDIESEDDLLQEAIETAKETQRASASLLQRKLKIGYARAARLLDIMEDKGIIGPGDGAKPREVYIPKDDNSPVEKRDED